MARRSFAEASALATHADRSTHYGDDFAVRRAGRDSGAHAGHLRKRDGAGSGWASTAGRGRYRRVSAALCRANHSSALGRAAPGRLASRAGVCGRDERAVSTTTRGADAIVYAAEDSCWTPIT